MVTCLGRESQYVELSFLFRNDLILRDISRINHVMVTWNYSEGSHHAACHTAQSDHNLSKQDSQPSVAHQVQYHQTPVRNNEKPWGTGIKKKTGFGSYAFHNLCFKKLIGSITLCKLIFLGLHCLSQQGKGQSDHMGSHFPSAVCP